MSMDDKIFQDDWGHPVRIETGVSLVGYDTVTLYVTKPSGTEVEWDLIVISPPLGTVGYTLVEGDINEVGIYKAYFRVEYLDGTNYTGKVDSFKVWERGT